jgi:sodium-dependent dicarboxylate transporter 2/3/5
LALSGRNENLIRWIGMLAGPVAAILTYLLLPAGYVDADGAVVELAPAARKVAAIAVLMAIWWMTEAISVYATALLPLALFPLVAIADMKTTATTYGSPVVYLFLGGFILALAVERWNLHRRLALNVLAVVGANQRAIIGAFMFVAAALSMWVTNTATTIMLLPVAVSVIKLLESNDLEDGKADSPFAVGLLLGIAYAASIGGMGTIIGTAPNVFVVAFIAEQTGREISFLEWMKFAVPVVIVFVPVVWFLLTRFIYPVSAAKITGADSLLEQELSALAAWSRGEQLTLVVFLFTAVSWVSRPYLSEVELFGAQPFAGLTDAGIAILAAVILFICPVSISKREFLMDWNTAVRLPWGLLVLFGGGLALAAQLADSGLSGYIGYLASGLEGLPVWLIVMVVIATVVFMTELTSNTATTATMLPVFLALALGLNLPTMLLVLPATLAASCAFMLPVATPPNAVVFGSGYLQIRQMSRAGLWLNLVAIGIISLATWLVIVPAFGITLAG